MSSLEAACRYGCSLELLEELLGRSKFDRGAPGSKSGLLLVACNVEPLFIQTVFGLLELGFDPNECTAERKSALMFAAKAGDLRVVKALIDRGADIHATDIGGRSIIHYALLSKSRELRHFLLGIIENWNATITVDFSGSWSRNATALHLAASLDNSALKFLLNNKLISDINHVTHQKQTALSIAVTYNIPRNVDLLLEANADATISRRGYPPLHLAARNGLLNVVNVFASGGVNLLLQNKRNLTAEQIARTTGNLDVAQVLKEKTSAGDCSRTLSIIMFIFQVVTCYRDPREHRPEEIAESVQGTMQGHSPQRRRTLSRPLG